MPIQICIPRSISFDLCRKKVFFAYHTPKMTKKNLPMCEHPKVLFIFCVIIIRLDMLNGLNGTLVCLSSSRLSYAFCRNQINIFFVNIVIRINYWHSNELIIIGTYYTVLHRCRNLYTFEELNSERASSRFDRQNQRGNGLQNNIHERSIWFPDINWN